MLKSTASDVPLASPHVRADCAGTSSLVAAATLRRLMEQQGLGTAQRQQLCGRIMGTHAHEMTSMTQQLLAGFDAEAGRRCGLQVRSLRWEG
jgi:hypothetical protein